MVYKYKIFAVLLFSLLFSFSAFADYNAYMTLGKEAYAAKDYDSALDNFRKAYAEKPTKELKTYLDNLEKNIAAKQKEKSTDNFKAIVLLGSDVALASVVVYAYLDYAGSTTAYETLFTSLNKTNTANYNILVYQKKQVEQKGVYMAVIGTVAGLAVLYTVGDLFFFHNAFEIPVRVSINPERQYAGLSKEWGF
jgi:tetratricopeptide (TPR) repeat protein